MISSCFLKVKQEFEWPEKEKGQRNKFLQWGQLKEAGGKITESRTKNILDLSQCSVLKLKLLL